VMLRRLTVRAVSPSGSRLEIEFDLQLGSPFPD
jgi:hypothetical protein